jgi:hypothetical protein
MKTVTIHATWHTQHTLEVEDDWRVPDTLDGFTEEQLEEMTTLGASLVDWE